MMLRNENK